MKNKFTRWLKVNKLSLNIFEKCLLFAPILLWFSHQPVISFGTTNTLFLDISLAEIYALILALLALPSILKHREVLLKHKSVWLVSAFVGFSIFSLLWTPSLLRGALTLGLIGILYLIFLGIMASSNIKKVLPALLKLTILSTLIMCAFAMLQFIAGIWLPSDITLLCGGCIADQFGFVRVTGLTVEPQYFGNMLLLPIFLLARQVTTRKAGWRAWTALLIIAFTLTLTLSRGAIFAFGAGVFVLLIVSIAQKVKLQKITGLVGVLVFGVVVAIFAQGLSAQINPSFSETFSSATAKSVHQLSLGVIDLRAVPQSEPDSTVELTDRPTNFDGYIEASTDYRLELSGQAVSTWWQSPAVAVFGVGLGGAGQSMANHTGEISALAIVQNEYLEILLELGLAGFLLFVSIIVGLLHSTRRHKWLWAVLVAFLVQWFFFSGYPNALHVYLVLAMIFRYSSLKQARQVSSR
ncbi:O-antigen ligase family protein [Candidatus Saccharibacteria bacterium]|nr:O-antigen ligase family protein [Candidatus Saccharibacteria bacterium]